MNLEAQLVEWLRANLPGGPLLEVPLGDDAAVLNPGTHSIVVTTDLLTEGVDFLLDQTSPQLVGHKALGVNLSDLAAMAARPTAAFVSLALPRTGGAGFSTLDLAIELYRGMLPLAHKHGVVIAGGDTNTWDGPLVVSITALGETTQRGPLTRTGAEVGDRLLVTGSLGGSILGRHLAVEPRVAEALLLHGQFTLHAGIDISDGLALDAWRLGEASGCGMVLDLDRIPVSVDAHELSQRDGRPAREHALADGEDFELLLAVPADAARQIVEQQPLDVPVTDIGEVIAERGLWQRSATGQKTPLQPQGWQHQAQA
jgi:thiamine-monophosphate kinase